MPSLLDPALLALLRRQAGVVSRAQALRAGLTAGQVDRLVARRRWTPLHPRVYLVADHPRTDEARVRAAVLWAGDDAVLGGLAALWWHGLVPVPPGTVALAVPRRSSDPPEGVVAYPRALRDGDVVTRRGLAVAVPPLALLDAAVDAGPDGVALLHALRAQVGLAELWSVAGRAASPAAVRRLLAEVSCTPHVHRGEWSPSRNRYS